MNCPSCAESILVMSERQGVEIDYCPRCRGVWLDRGELDKLVERATATSIAPEQHAAPRSQVDFVDSDFRSSRSHPGGRRKSWLGDIFD